MVLRVLTRVVWLCGLMSWAGCSGCGNGGGFDAGATETSGGGRFSLAWSLIDDTGTVNCTDVAACCNKLDANATVFIQANREGQGGVELFSCRSVQATSMTTFPPGVYNFTYDLRIPVGGHSVTIATATPQNGVVIEAGTSVPLAPIAFHVNLTGGLQLKLQAGAPGSRNCVGGADISGFTILLQHDDSAGGNSCQEVVFTLSGGGSYDTGDCSMPVISRCIESVETLSAASVPSGPYRIHIRGKNKGSVDCWTNDDMFAVPPQGAALVRTLNLAFASETAMCP